MGAQNWPRSIAAQRSSGVRQATRGLAGSAGRRAAAALQTTRDARGRGLGGLEAGEGGLDRVAVGHVEALEGVAVGDFVLVFLGGGLGLGVERGLLRLGGDLGETLGGLDDGRVVGVGAEAEDLEEARAEVGRGGGGFGGFFVHGIFSFQSKR